MHNGFSLCLNLKWSVINRFICNASIIAVYEEFCRSNDRIILYIASKQKQSSLKEECQGLAGSPAVNRHNKTGASAPITANINPRGFPRRSYIIEEPEREDTKLRYNNGTKSLCSLLLYRMGECDFSTNSLAFIRKKSCVPRNLGENFHLFFLGESKLYYDSMIIIITRVQALFEFSCVQYTAKKSRASHNERISSKTTLIFFSHILPEQCTYVCVYESLHTRDIILLSQRATRDSRDFRP